MSRQGTLSKQIVGTILAEYGLGALHHCTYVDRGYVNEKWLLGTERGQYLLKRRHANLRRPSLVEAQHALVWHLRSVGFPAPALVRTRNGRTFLEHGGEIYELQVHVPGEPYDAVRPAQLAASGRMLGFYHGAVRGFDHRALHQATERYGSAALSRIVKRLLEGWLPYMMSRLETLVQALEEQVQDLETRYMQFGELPKLVIHGDYHGANLVFQGDHLVGVVDYDLAHWSARAMEVAEAIIAFCTDPGLGLKHIVYPGALDLDVASRFMTAYLHQVPLTEMEIHALPDMIRTVWLCAALDPPLEPPLSREAAPKALPEILALANWAVGHGADLVEACLAAGQSWAEGRHPLSN